MLGNLAMGVGNDGAVVLLAMAYGGDEANTILAWRSIDNGKTWQARMHQPLQATKQVQCSPCVPCARMGMAVCVITANQKAAEYG